MNAEVAAGVLLIVAPIWFNTTFALLGRRFDYPDILRRPSGEILERFRAGGPSLILLWWAFMLSGLLLIAGVVLLGQVLGFAGIVPLAVTVGVLAGLVQMLGLLRWVYLVPALARADADPALDPDATRRERGGLPCVPPLPRGGCRGAPRLPVHGPLVRADRRRCSCEERPFRRGSVGRVSSWARGWCSPPQNSSVPTRNGAGRSQESRCPSSTSRGRSGSSRWG